MEGGGRPHEVLHLPRRSPAPLPSPLSNTLIPRDFLTQRSGAQDLRTNGADTSRNPRSPIYPSTPSPDVDTPSDSPVLSNMPSIANPHSPRPLHPKETTDNSPHAQRDPNGPHCKKSGAAKKEGGKRTHGEIRNNLRTVSSPVLSGQDPNQRNLTPPSSPRSTNSTGKNEHDIAKAALPRNSSMDSAISSISSSAEHSHRPSTDSTLPNSPEIQHLISTAGSAEKLISHLLQEKQHAASQNAQLWKLVDKQRSLLMGLNQDLERAIKDKEKYRQKLKDLQAQAQAQTQLSQQSNIHVPESSLPITDQVQDEPRSPTKGNHAPRRQDLANTPNNKPTNSLHSSPVDPSMVPSPLHLLQHQQKEQFSTETRASQGRSDQHIVTSQPGHVLDDGSTSLNERQVSNQNTHEAPEASFLASPSPTRGQSMKQAGGLESVPAAERVPRTEEVESARIVERPEKMMPPTRKPPPAPLNLNQAKPKASILPDSAPVDPSNSDIGKPQEVEEIAISDRGRRKTREEDDRDREFIAQRQEQARSRSSKSSKSSKSGKKKSKQDQKVEAPINAAPTVAASVLPSSPRQVAISPSSEASAAGPSPPNSIAAVLSPHSYSAAPVTERTLVAPPMSPGLPVSPRPVDRPLGSPTPRLPREGSGIPLSPPMSPRGAGPSLPLSPRPPRAAIPPPHTMVAVSTPQPHQQAFPQPSSPRQQERPRPTLTLSPVDKAENKESPVSPFHGIQVDRGLMDSAYPSLLLPPHALNSIAIKVSSSRLRPKRNSYMVVKANEEDPVFTLSIFSRSEGREMWRVEKVIMALPQLDQQMKSVSKFSTKLPERKLFSGHSPAIVDARRNALNHYFGELLEAAIDERSALVVCQFLSTDVIEARDDETSLLTPSQRSRHALTLEPDCRPVKEGYLTKRGKNFGGWKVRYFVLQGIELKYFESPGGTHLGTIKLQNAQIGKQTQTPSPSRTDDDVENQYRHAFLVLEPKRKDSSSLVRHVLCAESDQERDEWVLVLMQNVDNQSDEELDKQSASTRAEDGKIHDTGYDAKVKPHNENQNTSTQSQLPTVPAGSDELRSIGYEQVAAGTAPTMGVQPTSRRQDATPSPISTSSVTNATQEVGPAQDQQTTSYSSKAISGPKNGSIIQDVASWGNRHLPVTSIKEKKRSMWGFRQRAGSDNTQNNQPVPNESTQNFLQNQSTSARAVFGLPLAEAVELCPPRGVDVQLPAVVYRCIEYLRAKDATSEEGIFRLSGSNIVIKALRERFNTEGDVNFLADDQYYDVHAVASLFKSYLRELPTTVLTKELHLDFLHVLELDEKSKKIVAFNFLVHRLPRVNLALLRALSQYLIEIVNNADKNKMNVRNMGIVFSPTLNIPAPVFAMFLTDFDAIFGAEPEAVAPTEDHTRTVELSVPSQLTPDDIRSPRRQMFSDLPTPAYNQTTFPQGPPPPGPPPQGPPPPGQLPAQQSSMNPNPNPNPAPNANVANNTGFIPMQPSYETRTYVSDPQAPTQPQQRYSMAPPQLPQRPEYGSMNMMLAPSNAASLKARRRESSMLFMGMGNRKSTVPKMRDDAGESQQH
jgi:RalA-binding protein 1